MTLDALVTALACLSSTTPALKPNGPDMTISMITKNSQEPFLVDKSSGSCPAAALTALSARLDYMSDEVRSVREELNELQQLIDEYKNQAPGDQDKRNVPIALESRMLFPAALPTVIDETPRDCWDQTHGEVRIKPLGMEPFYVNCDQKERGGGWIVIAYRYDGSEDFFRDWESYKSGFGALNGEFFIGLEKLHRLTNTGDYELLIIMRTKSREQRFALYDQFSIGSEAEKYYLYVLGSFKGDADDSLRYHAGKKFTTFDQDNDDNAQNCARSHAGAWWYGRECFESNLFGTFQSQYGQEIGFYKGILWKTFLPGPNGSLGYVRMLIRPRKKKSEAD